MINVQGLLRSFGLRVWTAIPNWLGYPLVLVLIFAICFWFLGLIVGASVKAFIWGYHLIM